MKFIDQQEILNKTDGGRTVVEWMFPESHASFNNTQKKFKMHDEKSASTGVKKMADGTWVVTNFAMWQKGKNCIQLYMYVEGCDYKTAIAAIAAHFGIVPEADLPKVELKPIIYRRPALEEEQEGKWTFALRDFTRAEILSILAPKVWEYLIDCAEGADMDTKYATAEDRAKGAADLAHLEVAKVFARYNFYAVEMYTVIKDRSAIEISSTDKYPIFVWDQNNFKKVYQPKSADPGKRFMHYNGRPADFIFGEKQALKAYTELTAIQDEPEPFDETETKEDETEKKSKKQKLKQVTLVSGGSDGLNLACIGQCFRSSKTEDLAEQYWPVWMNSETSHLSHGQFKNLASLCEKVYNIPDIDRTGLREAHKVALEHLDMHTIYLPEELRHRRDFRNKECKDLRDYFRFYTVWDFFNLPKVSYPYRFWDIQNKYDRSGKKIGKGYTVNNVHLINFLHRNGFYRYEIESAKDSYTYVHIKDNVVKELDPRKIRDFVINFLRSRYADVALLNEFLRTTQLNENSLSNLPFVDIDFSDFDKQSQWMFFANGSVKVTADGIETFRPGMTDKYTWEEEIISKPFKLLDPFFTITKKDDHWDIDIANQDCLFFRYLINGSRLYWREELEDRLDGIPANEREDYAARYSFAKEDYKLMEGLPRDKAAAYSIDHHFNIAGPLLTAREQQEQKEHLINKIYAYGYIFHRYKDVSRAWAVWSMDAKITEGDDSSGGSGKSLGAQLINANQLLKTQYRDGRNKKLTDNQHIYENTTKHTDLFIIDDCWRFLNFDFFFGSITGPMQVNPKNTKQYTIPFSESPKLWFTSNYPPFQIDNSKARRILYTIFSDYYHHNIMNEYREDRGVRDDFGKNLGIDFDDKEWNLCLNFFTQCIRFYLSCPGKLNPPMENVNKRNLLSSMGDSFQGWADVYFSTDSDLLNTLVVKEHALKDFLQTTQLKWTTNKFTSSLKAWCTYNGHIFNPKEFHNKDGRIIRKVKEKKEKDGQIITVEISKEQIYIRTAIEAANIEMAALGKGKQLPLTTPTPPAADEDMPF